MSTKQISPNKNPADKVLPSGYEQQYLPDNWFNVVPTGLMLINNDGYIVKANHKAQNIFKTKSSEMLNKHLSQFFSNVKGEQKLDKIRDFINSARPIDDGSGFQVNATKLDGTHFPIYIAPLWTKNNSQNVGIFSIFDRTEACKSLKELENLQQSLEFKVRLRTIELADKVRERDAAQKKLKETLKTLQQTQDELIVSEKMSALGQLVAGVAHEINTPIGISLTAITHLSEKLTEISDDYQNQSMTKNGLENFLENSKEVTEIILSNINRASELIRSFKNIAVDQTSADKRVFELNEYLFELITSLRPAIKASKVEVKINCPKRLELFTFPGALAQVLTNLINNSIIHAFSPEQTGCITIDAKLDGDQIHLTYSDDGTGMDKATMKKVFDPFFTTKRGQGGSGLGMHLVFNLVTTTLQGKISGKSSVKKGSTFIITIPTNLKENN